MQTLLDLFCDFIAVKSLSDDSFLVGGTVRDILLDRATKDVDIALKGDAVDIGRSFADAAGGSFILLDADFGFVRVVKNHETIDICAMRGNSIMDDLADRDLTINAMAMPLSEINGRVFSQTALAEIVIDPFNGMHDLKYRIIRMVSEANLINDPLRLLRVYRFAATLNFTVEVHTSTAVRTHASLISNTAVERIVEELRHILIIDDSYSSIKEMDKDGLLQHLFPELTEFSPETWHLCRQSYGYVEHIMRNLPLYFKSRSEQIWDYFAHGHRLFCLKLTTLFQNGEIAEKVVLRLKLSRREVKFIRMISSSPEHISELDSGRKDVIIGTLRDFGEDIYALLIYILAGTHICQLSGNPLKSLAREIITIYQDEFIPRQKKLPLINGNDLIEEFRLPPSPFFKHILSGVELLVLEGRVNLREEALRVAGEMIKEGYHS